MSLRAFTAKNHRKGEELWYLMVAMVLGKHYRRDPPSAVLFFPITHSAPWLSPFSRVPDSVDFFF